MYLVINQQLLHFDSINEDCRPPVKLTESVSCNHCSATH